MLRSVLLLSRCARLNSALGAVMFQPCGLEAPRGSSHKPELLLPRGHAVGARLRPLLPDGLPVCAVFDFMGFFLHLCCPPQSELLKRAIRGIL